MGKEILDLPEKPVKSKRGAILLVSSLISYALFWVLSFFKLPFANVFLLICSVFLIVFSLEKFISEKEKTLIDFWIFLNVLIFILALTLRSLSHPNGNFVLLLFITSAGLMLVYYFVKKSLTRNSILSTSSEKESSKKK